MNDEMKNDQVDEDVMARAELADKMSLLMGDAALDVCVDVLALMLAYVTVQAQIDRVEMMKMFALRMFALHQNVTSRKNDEAETSDGNTIQ